jgi:hypothetical protein
MCYKSSSKTKEGHTGYVGVFMVDVGFILDTNDLTYITFKRQYIPALNAPVGCLKQPQKRNVPKSS